MTHVMVDLETLGVNPGSVIISIGAVEFEPGEELSNEFYRSIDIESCEEVGLEIEADTLSWWMEQDEDVQDVLTGGEDLRTVLEEFNSYYDGADWIWANSPSFDCEMLKAAYDATDLQVPWEFRDERCFRTIRSIPGAVWVKREGDHHNALDDAKYQAMKTKQTLERLRNREQEDWS